MVHRVVPGLILLLALVTGFDSQAQLLATDEWDTWNEASMAQFPGETWRQYATPEEAGWSSEGLESAHRMSDAAGSAAALMVFDGVILAQWGQVERRFMCHSVRKSLLSALYGIAVSESRIDIEATIGSIGIDDHPGLTTTEKSAKVSDLLKSRSGIYLPAAYETPDAKKSRPIRGSHEPGTHWYYNNWDFNVLATIYNRKTAGDLFEAFQAKIADPLQMQDFALRHTYYHLEPENSLHPAYPFRMSGRDLARFGLLFLNEGRWRDAQIVPAEWVRESTKAYSETPYGGYGYMWWTVSGQLGELGTYLASGYGGHTVYVVPKAKLVFVHRADTYRGKHVNHRSIWNIVKQVLNARTGPSKTHPELVAVAASPGLDPGPSLSEAQLARLTGRYRRRRDGLFITVSAAEGQLLGESPRYGRFILIPRTETTFLVEDAEFRIEFETDSSTSASALRIWSVSDEPSVWRRVP